MKKINQALKTIISINCNEYFIILMLCLTTQCKAQSFLPDPNLNGLIKNDSYQSNYISKDASDPKTKLKELVHISNQETMAAAFKQAYAAAKFGPTKVPLVGQAVIQIPANYFFVPRVEAKEYMDSMGNHEGSNFVGMIMADDNNSPWLLTISYVDSGYVEDKEAANWKADQLLREYIEGTEEGNNDRIARGFDALKVNGWLYEPKYSKVNHQATWTILAEEQFHYQSIEEQTVNYFVYLLGREGYFKFDLVTNRKTIEKDKQEATNILQGFNFVPGKHYEDYSPEKDKLAKFGITALVTAWWQKN